MPFHPGRPKHARRPPTTPDQTLPVDAPLPDVDGGQLLYTPAEAAVLLRVRESWLRRKAGARVIPCTFLGRHLRFSPADLAAIVASHTQAAGIGRRRRRQTRTREPDLIPAPHWSVHAPDGDDHNGVDGSSAWLG